MKYMHIPRAFTACFLMLALVCAGPAYATAPGPGNASQYARATLSAPPANDVVAGLAMQLKYRNTLLPLCNINPTTQPGSTYQESLIKPYLDQTGVSVTLRPEDTAYLKDAVVLVAGFAGPVGIELTETLLKCGVKEIVALDRNDTETHHFMDRAKKENLPVTPYLIDIAGEGHQYELLKAIFQEHQPTVIFHLANYKSLMLGNENASSYIINNIGTTLNLLELLTEENPRADKRFIYVSSGKAEAPNSLYAKTKLLSEFLIRNYTQIHRHLKTSFVRLSNPVDTSGCFVMRTFLEKIKYGETIFLRTKDGQYPARHFTRRSDNVKAAIIAGACAEDDDPAIIAFNTKRFPALPVDALIHMLAARLAIPHPEEWYRTFVRETPLLPGERLHEANPRGAAVPGNPFLLRVESTQKRTITPYDAEGLILNATHLNNAAVLNHLSKILMGYYFDTNGTAPAIDESLAYYRSA